MEPRPESGSLKDRRFLTTVYAMSEKSSNGGKRVWAWAAFGAAALVVATVVLVQKKKGAEGQGGSWQTILDQCERAARKVEDHFDPGHRWAS